MFESARLKIERADKHIEELEAAINAFLESDHGRVATHTDEETGSKMVYAVDRLPDEIAPLMGDALHNLRCAFDHMFHEIARSVGGETKTTLMKVGNDRHHLETLLNTGPIKTAHQSVRDFILNTIKPYRGGNEDFLAIHDLDAWDKHAAFVPLVTISVKDGVFKFVNLDGHLRPLGLPTADKIINKGYPAMNVLFGEGEPLEMKPVIKTLRKLSEITASMIDGVEEVCPDT